MSDTIDIIEGSKRRGVNTKIQSMCSDITQLAINKCIALREENKLDYKFINTTHDSAELYISFKDLKKALKVITKVFTKDVIEYTTKKYGLNYKLGLVVEYEIGSKLSELNKWDFSETELDYMIKNIKKQQLEHL